MRASSVNSTGEVAYLWEPGLAGVELYQAHLVRHSFGKHFHEAYTIGLNDGGLGSFGYRGQTRYAYAGSLNLVEPGGVHTGQAESQQGWRFRNFYIGVPLMEQMLTQMEEPGRGLPYFPEPVVEDPQLVRFFSQLFQTLNVPVGRLTQQSLLLEAVARLVAHHGMRSHPPQSLKPNASPQKAIQTARDYLEAHYAKEISLDELAQVTGLSPYHLVRSFSKQVGLPPHRYQTHWQVLRAKQDLRTGKPLAAIATDHGFYDQSHFNRHFKRVFGVTPGQYRRNFVQYR